MYVLNIDQQNAITIKANTVIAKDVALPITLYGQSDTVDCGQELQNNCMYLLENYSSVTSVNDIKKPIPGMLWFDRLNATLYLYTSYNRWKQVLQGDNTAGAATITCSTSPPIVNSTLTAQLINEVDNPITISNYKWYKGASTLPIASGATTDTYVPVSTGAYYVEIEYTDKFGDVTVKSSKTIIAAVTDVPGKVEIVGSPKVGTKLTAVLTDPDKPLSNVKYEWFSYTGGATKSLQNSASDSYTPITTGIIYVVATYNDYANPNAPVSATSDKVTVADSLQALEFGSFWKGGFYVGRIKDNGAIYDLIMSEGYDLATLKSGYSIGLTYKSGNGKLPSSTTSKSSGKQITEDLMNVDPTGFPAAQFCADLDFDGYNDWYLPAIHELELLYYNVTPYAGASSVENNDAVPPHGVYSRDYHTFTTNDYFLQRSKISKTDVILSSTTELDTYKDPVAVCFIMAYGSVSQVNLDQGGCMIRPFRREYVSGTPAAALKDDSPGFAVSTGGTVGNPIIARFDDLDGPDLSTATWIWTTPSKKTLTSTSKELKIVDNSCELTNPTEAGLYNIEVKYHDKVNTVSWASATTSVTIGEAAAVPKVRKPSTLKLTGTTVNKPIVATLSGGELLDKVEWHWTVHASFVNDVITEGKIVGDTATCTINLPTVEGPYKAQCIIYSSEATPSIIDNYEADINIGPDPAAAKVEAKAADTTGGGATTDTTTVVPTVADIPKIDTSYIISNTKPSIGDTYRGGIYVGNYYDTVQKVEYQLIVATRLNGESTDKLAYHPTKSAFTDTTLSSTLDGFTATNYAADGYSGFDYCKKLQRNVTLSGGASATYTDWYLPSRNELEVMYYNLKPNSTANKIVKTSKTALASGMNVNSVPSRNVSYTATVPAVTNLSGFKLNSWDAFATNVYMSSTGNSSGFVGINFEDGENTYHAWNEKVNVRAIRRELSVGLSFKGNVVNLPVVATILDKNTPHTNIEYNWYVSGEKTPVYTSNTSDQYTPTASGDYLVTASYTDKYKNAQGTSAIVTVLDSPTPGPIGSKWKGGYYAGEIKFKNGAVFYLIVSPRAQGILENMPMLTAAEKTAVLKAPPSLTDIEFDGYTTSRNATLIKQHALLTKCDKLNAAGGINGFKDWYIPSKAELDIIYRHFKPTTDANFGMTANSYSTDPADKLAFKASDNNPAQTKIEIFQGDGSESYVPAKNQAAVIRTFCSSTYGAKGTVAAQMFDTGRGLTVDLTANEWQYTRLIRREKKV